MAAAKAKKLGRPTVPESRRSVGFSLSLKRPELESINRIAREQGISRSQVMSDALQALKGELQETIGQLRMELAQQHELVDNLQNHVNSMQVELKRLQGSQSLVDAIVNPYGGPDASLGKLEAEKARTVRAIILNNREEPRRILELLAQGDTMHRPLDIHAQGLKVWGSWEAYWNAVKTALQAKGAK